MLEVPIDFETFYDTKSGYTLSKMTAEEYIRDPRFQIIGLGIRWPGYPTRWLSGMTHQQLAATLQRLDWSNVAAIGHNLSEFDSLILTEVLGVRPRYYQCTMAMGRQLHGSGVSNSLAALCKQYGLPDKGDEVIRADGKRLEDFTPQELAAYGAYCINDVDRCFDLYNIFKTRLPATERVYAHMLARMWAEPRLELDGYLLQRLGDDLARRKAAALKTVGELLHIPTEKDVQAILRSDGKFAEALCALGVEPPTKISKKTGKEAFAFAKTDRAMEELADHEDEDVQTLVAARLGVKTTQMETRVARFAGIAARGRLPAALPYGRTQTMRAAGGGKLNLQNLPRNRPITPKTPTGTLCATPDGIKSLDGVTHSGGHARMRDGTVYDLGDDTVHIAGLRDCICAPEGKLLVVVDSSNIELRVAHCLAGQMDTVEKLRNGEDLYSWFASDLYGYPVNKKQHPKERQHGKVGMLQLQYQSGAGSFQNAARVMGGVILTPEQAKHTVDVYRARFPQLPKFWRSCANAIEDMANGRQSYIDQWGLCRTDHEQILLPSGPPMRYQNLRREAAGERVEWRYDDKEKRFAKKIYGGMITENLSQRIARDVVFEQMAQIERRWGAYEHPGNGVALTVHDEVVVVVDEADADECLKFSVAAMSQPPKWWPELPVAAEGAIGVYYGEAK